MEHEQINWNMNGYKWNGYQFPSSHRVLNVAFGLDLFTGTGAICGIYLPEV